MSNYLIELSLIHMLLIGGYFYLLRKEQQYGKMRFYLISATLLALIVPLLKFPKLFSKTPDVLFLAPITITPFENNLITESTEVTVGSGFSILWIYCIICGLLILKFLTGLIQLFVLKYKSEREFYNGTSVQKVKNIKGSFTFFNWIFVDASIPEDQEDYDVILKHEHAHSALGHTYDLVFFELFRAFFWWLPSAWYIKREIKKIHEYQADAHALQSVHIDLYSSIMISSTLKSNGLSLASSFHDGLIFKRINAMKQKAQKVRPWKMGMLFSLCSLMVILFACSEEKGDGVIQEATAQTSSEQELFRVVEEQPTYEGGWDALYRFVTSEIRYPLEARQGEIEGQVHVQFVVERDGSVSNVEVAKGIGSGCDEEAVRVVKQLSDFNPGSQRGKTVRVLMTLPIQFKLNPEKKNPDNSSQGNVIIGEIETQHNHLHVDARYKDGMWYGTVRNDEGSVMPGANIVVVGTNFGTVSDLDGTFKVEATTAQKVQVSFVGYKGITLSSGKN